MTKAKQVHVTPNANGGWKGKTTGKEKAFIVGTTKEEVLKKSREVAKNQGAELVIHKKDGTIQNKDSFGNDPCPPKDTK
jgi:hypothetical protein